MVAVVGVLATLTACAPAEPSSAPTDPPTASPGETSSDRDRTETPTPPPRDPLADAVEGLDLADRPVLGADVSWPQCPKGMGIPQKRSQGSPMPVDEARYVIVGLTNGPGFYPNPCLAAQVEWVRSRRLMAAAYAVASYPDPEALAEHGGNGPFDSSTSPGALANTGYQQARFNVASMESAGLLTPVVWIDVEPVPDFGWSGDPEANAAVVTGVARGYRDAGYRVGVYSTPSLWAGVVGGLELGVPEWRAAGQTSAAEALARCRDDWVIQGGQGVIGQWVEAGRDQNITCPGTAAEMNRWFHQY